MKYILTLLLATCTLSLWAQDFGSYELKKLEKLNSNVAEFSPVPYQNGLVFTSDRSKGKLVACYDKTGGRYMDIFVTESLDPEGLENAKRLLGEANSKYHDGAPVFSKDGNTMYFTRNDLEGKNDEGIIVENIYQAQKTADGWDNLVAMPFNVKGFNTLHPTLSYDGNTMYFASNRPGSMGGNDIYKVSRNADGVWGEPMNLGETINTSGNEVFPYMSDTGMLYYSSDKLGSMGGLDIFMTSPKGDDWTTPRAMMAPLNSTADDLTFVIVEAGKKGYFASAREGGMGKDDIYEWKYNPPALLDVDMLVVDARNDNPLDAAEVGITAAYCDIPVMNDAQSGTTGADGKFAYQLYDACTYLVTVTRAGYEPYEMELTGMELKDAGTYKVPLTPLTSEFSGNVFSTKDQSAIPGATIVLVNTTTGEEQTLTADADGNFSTTLICTDNYELRGTAKLYKEGMVALPATEINCSGATAKNIGLEPNPPVVIILENVYYNFDKADIRPDAAERLDKLVETMQKYPSLEIEFRSHTDARGSNTYNTKLAERRAKNALEYVVSKGIDAVRVAVASFGETQLANECANRVKCTEEEHQRNRRTTISVRRFNAENMRIQIVDNPTFPPGAGKGGRR